MMVMTAGASSAVKRRTASMYPSCQRCLLFCHAINSDFFIRIVLRACEFASVYDIMFYKNRFEDHHSERVAYMPQRPVTLEPGRDGDPGRAEEDWLAWCESVEGQMGSDEGEPDDAAPWDADVDALIAECREITAEEAAFAARAAARGLPGGTPVAEGRRGPGQPGSAVRRPGEFASRAAGFGAGMLLDTMPGCGAL